MNNNNVLVWLLVAAAAFGGVWYLLAPSLGGSGAVPTATTTPAVATSTTAAPKATTKAPVSTAPKPTKTTAKTAGIGSLSSLLTSKEPLVCTVKTMSGYARSGTLYIANGRARANFVNSSMIDDGSYLYAWTKGATTGVTYNAASSASGSAIANAGGVDLSTDLSYACNTWVVDTSVFTPPASVTF